MARPVRSSPSAEPQADSMLRSTSVPPHWSVAVPVARLTTTPRLASPPLP